MSPEPSPTSLTPALVELEEVARLRTERDHLTVRHAAAQVDASRAEARVQAAAKQLASEKDDVVALEKMSLTRVMSSLRGRRFDDLEREQGEVRAAEYTYAVERARWQDAVREEAELVRRLNALGLVDQRWERALEARSAEFESGSTQGIHLASIAERLGRAEADRGELLEALEACVHAGAALTKASKKLSTASEWATYDTFFGGGMLADMAKHQRLDEATALMKAADQALHHLGNELADVGIGAIGGLDISDMSRTFDVWFDNIFSDWSIAEKIKNARKRVDATLQSLAALDTDLRSRLAQLDSLERDLSAERENLLTT